MITKTFRLYDTEKETIVKDALTNHKKYGYDNERQMIIDALYKLTKNASTTKSSLSSTVPIATAPTFDEDCFINKLLSRLKSELVIASPDDYSSESGNSPDSNSKLSSANDNDIDTALDFIDSLI